LAVPNHEKHGCFCDAEDGATAVWWAKFGEFASIEGLQHVPLSVSSLRILCPNGHLGFAPIKTGSFRIGLGYAPDLICADSGSCDVGPGPLGADVSSSPVQWQ
jgi:hypothetical protein